MQLAPAPHRSSDELSGGRAGQLNKRPDRDEHERGEQAFRARQETKHDEAEPEIVSLGQRVQAAQCVGESQQSHRTGEKEKYARADRNDG